MATNDRAWVVTRKGLFLLRRHGSDWRIEHVSLLGEQISMLLPPPPGTARMLVSLTTGHSGAKLHAGEDAGHTWNEVAAPTYPPQPEVAAGPGWKLLLIWALARGTVWAGTLPEGLFRSPDFGRSWELIEPLWQRPVRLGWFGGAYPVRGIHGLY